MHRELARKWKLAEGRLARVGVGVPDLRLPHFAPFPSSLELLRFLYRLNTFSTSMRRIATVAHPSAGSAAAAARRTNALVGNKASLARAVSTLRGQPGLASAGGELRCSLLRLESAHVIDPNGMGLGAARPLPHLGAASPRQLNRRRLASTLTSEAEAGALQDQKKPLFDKILIANR